MLEKSAFVGSEKEANETYNIFTDNGHVFLVNVNDKRIATDPSNNRSLLQV